MSDQWVVFLLFVAVFAGIVSEKLDKVVIVLGGAIVLVLAGYLKFEQAVEAIDFNTIGLLFGMMLLVGCLVELRVFDVIAMKLGLLTRGSPPLIFFAFGAATAVLSAFLDNVTTVLVMIPLVISLTQGIGVDPRPYVLGVIFMSNIGGTATLIGDPPNILIGSRVPSLTFVAFMQYLTLPVIVAGIAVSLYVRAVRREHIQRRDGSFTWLFASNLVLEQMRRRASELHVPTKTLVQAGAVGAITLIGFFTHPLTHVEPAVVAIAGATLALTVFSRRLDLHHTVARVEWPTLLFFCGLFVVVGGVEHVGLLELAAHFLTSLTDNLWGQLMIVLWASAILSAIVDNIPFVAVMIPILTTLTESETFASQPNVHLLWWALSLGACFGGNGTAIGASANVVSVAIARSRGVSISFPEFLRLSVPVTAISVLVASVYLTILNLF